MIYKDFNTNTSNAYDVDAIKNSIRNILMTRIGSVPGKPNFGSNLYLLVFEQLDNMTVQLAKRYTVEAIARFEDRVTILSVNTSKDEAFNRLIINIVFSYTTDLGKIQSDSTNVSFNL